MKTFYNKNDFNRYVILEEKYDSWNTPKIWFNDLEMQIEWSEW